MEKAGKFISGALCWIIAAAACVLGFYYAVLPESLSAETFGGVSGSFCGAKVAEHADGGCQYMLGGMEIKPVALRRQERRMLVPCGEPFGIKLRTDGVMVVSVNAGSPADKCGIRAGDMITSVNGAEVCTNSEIGEAVQGSPDSCTLIVRRGSSEKQIKLTPEAVDGCFRLGAWVRDSAAGIGTLTFCDPDTGRFAGLGHPVSDVTTGELMPLSSGEATSAEIYSTIKGRNGETGELCGELCEKNIGNIEKNTQVGVFGVLDEEVSGTPLPMAFKQEVECGPAVILATLQGSAPQEYSIEIEKVNLCAMGGTKSMVIRVTDERLLDEAGGIVRGMSGSPIIQNGMIAGAVTHVFVNDPTRGYAVFAESMVDEMESGAAQTALFPLMTAESKKICNCVHKCLDLSQKSDIM